MKVLLPFLLFGVVTSFNPITPPPRKGNLPQIANGRIYYLDHIPRHCQPPIIDRFPGGREIKDNRALIRKDSPHEIRGNIEIASTGCLYIEPGTELRFAAGFGIIVNGTLIARGSDQPGERIVMTKLSDQNLHEVSGNWQDDARLSMGNTTKDGRLDLKYSGRWRAVCTNYNNFTAIDANVTCRHLGFLKGNFTYHSYARNLTDYILWEKPDCRGSENSLFDCPGINAIKTGRHICDGQQVVGFSCEGLRPGLAEDHWRGIDFYNSTKAGRYQIQGNYVVYMDESDSFLEYLDILYPGLDIFHGQTDEYGVYYQKAAISASPLVPRIDNVTVLYGAYDAINFTEVTSPIWIANSTFSHNRGYGMFIQSSVGHTLINSTEVSHNWGDGIKFYLSNLTIFDFRKKFPPEQSLCEQADMRSQIFPIYQHLDLVQVNGDKRVKLPVGGYCDRTYTVTEGMRIGIHFLILERDPMASGEFIFRDGNFEMDPIPVHNGSFPQSITTRSNVLRLRFNYKVPRDLICKDFPPCIRFLIELTASYDVEEEFRLLMSSVHNNVGYGVNIQDIRSKVRISNETVVSHNQFGAGIRVYRGAGEIVVNGTRLEGNADAGINITYAGGFQLINNTVMEANKGYGVITEYLQFNSTRIEKENRVEIVRSNFTWNELIGLRMGNYCKAGDVKVNESYFAFNYDEAFEYLSCNISTPHQRRLRIEFNRFEKNFRHALFIHPFLNTHGIMTNNTFENHSLAAVRIDNGYNLLISRWYRNFPVDFHIFENRFLHNRGRYALSLRLTQHSGKQQILCKFNYFEDNEINNTFLYLQPRSKANAVVVVSSSNVKFIRNYINNPESVRELSTHLVDPSVVIDASENFWGFEVNRQEDFRSIYKSIFDQNNRFNLARIQYQPALRTRKFYEDFLTNVPPFEWSFSRPGNIIGGELEIRQFTAQRGQTYYVDRDIFIHPNMVLEVQPGAQLRFGPSVGMVVHGILKADGQHGETPVVFDLDDRQEWLPLENRTASVRLVDGATEFEGRLEVEIDGVWGTVCSDGWIEEDALLACQQLGLSYNRANPSVSQRVRAPGGTPIMMSWVSCTGVDVDLTQCRAINGDAASCTHNQDVYLRCQRPTWAGITLAPAYRLDQQQPGQSESQIRHVQILRAGLLDPDTATLTPALRIDYNFYQISWLRIQHAVSDAIHVYYSHPFTLNKMEYLTLTDNGESGLVTHSPQLSVNHSFIERNRKVGFLYDPFLTEYEALLIRNMIHPIRRVNLLDGESRRVVRDGHMMFLITEAGEAKENTDYYIEIKAHSVFYGLTVQVMDYLPVESAEKVTIYDSSRLAINDPNTHVWEIERDLVDFPIMSKSQMITIKVTVNGLQSGRLALVVISRRLNNPAPRLVTAMTNTTVASNEHGVITKHYNSPSNKRLELFFRHKTEEIYFKDLRIKENRQHAMHMPSVTKFHEDYIPTYEDMTTPERVATIVYSVYQSVLTNNQMGILAEHNHVDFANNVWQWTLKDVTVEGCSRGGLEIEVPRVNEQTNRQNHAVHVKDCAFKNNRNFAFSVAGYYADVKINNNNFLNNRCLLGLISLQGMEKSLMFHGNAIEGNVGRYVLDMDILSHSDHSTDVVGSLEVNKIVDNHYDGPVLPGSMYKPKTYTLAIKGLQNVRINTNIFNNRQFDYELVAGVTALSLDNHMDVTRNFWGYSEESAIRERIFDFDDWNNYAIADYFPFLQSADFKAVPTAGEQAEILVDPKYLGGRIERSQTLIETGEPYIVVSDVTVMPDVTLNIPPGTELLFRPDVGILVLGNIVANGLPFSRIKMKPLPEGTSVLPQRRGKRDTGSSFVRLRGDGTLFKNAGFLELYNASSRSWNMMCDSLFNEKTAEVVCRELGKETINVKVRFTHLYDHFVFGKPMYFRKEFWFTSYHCRGDETHLEQCITRYNYNLQSCIYAANYTFITCGDRNLEANKNYWGNIRFSNTFMEEKALEADKGKSQSEMTYVDIEGAGILHGQKVGAIQTTYVTPRFENINITKCASNGYDIVAPRQHLKISMQNVSHNLGFGVNVLILNGESRDDKSSFLPNGAITIPYNVYGMVDICSMEKEIVISTRIIVFYKYGPQYRDCVKIIKAKNSYNTVGLRLLQINLFREDFSRNVIEIFDGRDTRVDQLLASIVANSSQEDILTRYDSTGDTLSIHMHASVGHEIYGFVAEVVKLPFSGLTYPNSEIIHQFEHAEMRRNEDGAIRYKNVGEVNPSLFIEHCFIYDNGFPILNLTSPPSVDISLQSTVSFRMSHNQITHNKGGVYLFAHTSSINTALNGNITNNVFAFGSHGEALNISGHYFPRLMLHQNYIYNYTAGDFRDVIHIKDVVVNLTQNYILRNLGHYILHMYSNDDSTASQIYAKNGIYNNNSTALVQSTIKVGEGSPKFSMNYLVNSLNDFEMETYPKRYRDEKKIGAKNNWWGSERRVFISGKIFDHFDNPSLTEVDFWPPIVDNRSLIEGNCLPGWVEHKGRCYRYMGGALPYQQAKEFCQSHGAFLAESRDRESFFNYLLRLQVIDQWWADRVWVMSDVGLGRCSAFERNYVVEEEDCQRRYYPFLCETDPSLALPSELADTIQAMIIGISVGVGGVILIIVLVICILWALKSKRREKERFERTASIRSSLNNLNKIGGSIRGTKSTLTMLSEGQGHSRRRLNDFDDRSVVSTAKTSHSSAVSNGFGGSMYSINSVHSLEGEISAPQPARRDTPGRPVHSLKPDRGAGRRGIEREREEREREERERAERERRRQEDEERDRMRRRRRMTKDEEEEASGGCRGNVAQDSDDDSVEKDDFSDSEDESDSYDDDENNGKRGKPDDDEIDAKNLQYHKVHRSFERLIQRPEDMERPSTGFGRRVRSREDLEDGAQAQAQALPPKKPFSSFAQPDDPSEPPVRNIHYIFPRTPSREELPTPPPDPRRFGSASNMTDNYNNNPKPTLKPKPIPSSRRDPLEDASSARMSPAPSDRSQSSNRPNPVPRQKNLGSQDLYKNAPLYDPVYNDRGSESSGKQFPRYRNMPDSDHGSNVGPVYDPVYDGSRSDHSRSTDKYEPIDYNPHPYGRDQAPEMDYLPRKPANFSLGSSRERLGPPPPAPAPIPRTADRQYRLESDIDSYAPSLQSDVDFLPRHPPRLAGNTNLDDVLPPKPGMPSQPSPYQGSRDRLNNAGLSMEPPPYTEDPRMMPRSMSRDGLDSTQYRGSRERLEDRPPPYSPGGNDDFLPRRHGGTQDVLHLGTRAQTLGGSQDNVLYLGTGARPKHHQSVETEI